MTYFYKIGDCVLASDQVAQRHESDKSQNFRLLSFSDNATVSVIEPGDTYKLEEEAKL